jgi:hypothetical protein
MPVAIAAFLDVEHPIERGPEASLAAALWRSPAAV